MKKNSIRMRLLGLTLLGMVMYINLYHRAPGDYLWICNLSALICALGLFTGFKNPACTGAIWMLLGTLVFFIDDLFNTRDFDLLSYFSHTLYAFTGIVTLRRNSISRYLWLYSISWFWLTQLLARLLTESTQNINLAFNIWPGWENYFSGYWQYWIFLSLGSAIILKLINLMLLRQK